MVETVDSIKLADELNKKWSSISPNDPLQIFVQINTSLEEGTHSFIEKTYLLTVSSYIQSLPSLLFSFQLKVASNQVL